MTMNNIWTLESIITVDAIVRALLTAIEEVESSDLTLMLQITSIT